jgi:hypothetical protein
VRLEGCQGTATVADHITRPQDGGAELDPSNLRAACRYCNLLRHHSARQLAELKQAILAEREQPPWRDGLPRDECGLPAVRFHEHQLPSGFTMLIGHSQRTARCACEPTDAA